ncbi:RraA family protein [Erwinia sp. S43]|uniref:RraA family protein n=1 Tax=Erwinia sp. S43 TaxID=2769339 RepID=UPI00190C88A2|nr:RraA family protein [Erwinia sp. S43]MBK0032769.1 RraA family protein [Erwinia sp. S43]
MSYGKRINASFERPDPQVLARLAVYATPDLCDVAGIFDCMTSSIKPWVSAGKIVGPALTVRVPPGEGGIIPTAIELAQPGDIVVIDGKGNTESAYWGDQRGSLAVKHGAIGVIIDGAFRDIDDCEKIGLPIFARGLTCGASGKAGTGEINVAISCGGVVVNPGDIVFADRNGVCVIPLQYAADVAARLEQRFPR